MGLNTATLIVFVQVVIKAVRIDKDDVLISDLYLLLLDLVGLVRGSKSSTLEWGIKSLLVWR